MAYEYTTVTVDLTENGSGGATGTIYAELFHTVTLANNDTVAPQVYSATVTAGAATLTLPCTATALMNTNAPFLVTFVPTGGKRRTLGRIITTESASAVQLSDLLEVGGSSAVPVTTYNVEATNLVTSPSITHLQAIRNQDDNARVLVEDVGLYRYDTASALTADEDLVVTPASATGRWRMEIDARVRLNVYDVRRYGYVGSAADSVAAINLAIDAAYAAGGGAVQMPAGTIRCDTQIVLKDKVYLELLAATVLDFSAAGSITSCISAVGTAAATSVAFNTNIAKGDKAIVFPSAPAGVSAGDILVIYNSADSSFNAARTYYRAGEFVRVSAVAAGTVSLDQPVFAAYTAGGTVSVYKVTPVTCGVRGGRIIAKAGLNGIKVTYGAYCYFEDVRIEASDMICLGIDRCYGTSIDHVQVRDVAASNGNNYGISIDNSQLTHVTNCFGSTTRHSLTTGGADVTAGVPVRQLLVTDSTFGSNSDSIYGADIHGNAELVTYANCEFPNAVDCGGKDISIINCRIKTTKTDPSGIYMNEVKGGVFLFQGNTIEYTATGTGSSNTACINGGGNHTPYTSADSTIDIRVLGNTFVLGAFPGQGINVANTSSDQTIRVEARGNRLIASDQTATRFAVYLDCGSNKIIDKAVIQDNHFTCAGIRLNQIRASLIDVSRNVIQDSTDEGIRVIRYATSYAAGQATQAIILRENTILSAYKTPIYVSGDYDGTQTYIVCQDNTTLFGCQGGNTGSGLTNTSITMAYAVQAWALKNTIGKLASASFPNRTIGLSNVTNFYNEEGPVVGPVLATDLTSVTNTYLTRPHEHLITFHTNGAPAAAHTLTFVAPYAMTIPATFAGSYGRAAVAATAQTDLLAYVNGAAAGGGTQARFRWAAAGTSASLIGTSAIALAAGDRLTLLFPNPADATLANVGVTILAYRT